MQIILMLDFKPVAWKRPAGQSVRYDSQVADKAAFSAAVIKELNRTAPDMVSSRGGKPLFESKPLAVSLDFYFGNHKRKMPDIDNLAKFTLDAMQSELCTGLFWHDDEQVHRLTVKKTYADKDRTLIQVSEHY